MPRRSFDTSRQRAFCFAYAVNPFIGEHSSNQSPDLLFSFVGAPTHRTRARIRELADPEAWIEDSRSFSLWRTMLMREVERFNRHYAAILARSKFVLCPRGVGTSTYRLFEALEAGRAPVLISDDWVEPEGPSWHGFLLRVPESEVGELPAILRRHEGEAQMRGLEARRAWEQWFAPDVRFHTAVEACLAILEKRRISEQFRTPLLSLEYHRVRTRRTASRLRQAWRCRLSHEN